MNLLVLDNEVVVRLGVFIAIFLSMAVWEVIAPRRPLTQRKSTRWANNLALTLLNAFLLRLLFPTAAVGVALLAEEKGWGFFNSIAAPASLKGFLCIVILDLAIYTQHLLFHKVPLLWRLHRMHHTDLDVDVTTGARFHPLEILLSMGIKMGIIAALGAPAWTVVFFEVLLNGTSMFNHSNISLNAALDLGLRLFLVTPDMHRVHHSVIMKETDSNFGFNFPWWDRVFRTYRDQPMAGHTAMALGLANYRDPKWLTLPWMFLTPFSPRSR